MTDFKCLVHAETEDAFNELWEEFLAEWDEFPVWIKYVSSEWLLKKKQWSQAWCKVCTSQSVFYYELSESDLISGH